MKKLRTIDEVAKDANSFLKLFVFNRVQYKYPTFESYLVGKSVEGSKHDLKHLCHIGKNIIHALTFAGKEKGKSKYVKLNDVIPLLMPTLVHRCKVFNRKSGFKLPSWWQIPDEYLKEMYDNPPTLDNLTERAKTIWCKYVVKSDEPLCRIKSKAKGNKMTKIEKENLRKECEMGLHALPADVLIKDQEKKERSEKKRKETIAKNAAREVLSELKTENDNLKTEINGLNAELSEASKKLEESDKKVKKFTKYFKSITHDRKAFEAFCSKYWPAKSVKPVKPSSPLDNLVDEVCDEALNDPVVQKRLKAHSNAGTTDVVASNKQASKSPDSSGSTPTDADVVECRWTPSELQKAVHHDELTRIDAAIIAQALGYVNYPKFTLSKQGQAQMLDFSRRLPIFEEVESLYKFTKKPKMTLNEHEKKFVDQLYTLRRGVRDDGKNAYMEKIERNALMCKAKEAADKLMSEEAKAQLAEAERKKALCEVEHNRIEKAVEDGTIDGNALLEDIGI